MERVNHIIGQPRDFTRLKYQEGLREVFPLCRERLSSKMETLLQELTGC